MTDPAPASLNRCGPSAGLLLVLFVLLPIALAAQPAVSSADASDLVERQGPERLKQTTRIVLDTNAPAGTVTTNAQKSFTWKAEWRGWDGLHLGLEQRTSLTNSDLFWGGVFSRPNAPVQIHLDQVKLTLNAGSRVAVDGAAYKTTGNLAGFNNNAQLRRAYINLDGDCILLMPMSYLIQVGYIPDSFYVNKSYLLFPNIRYVGNLQIGVFGPPMGLDLITSSRDITFMEPAAPFQAMGPPNEVGIQIGQPVFSQRATWALGIFGDTGGDNQFGNNSRDYGNAMGRVTWLAIDHRAPGNPTANQYLHLGLSANYQYSASSQIQYKSRPESYIAPSVIDTGDIDASAATVVAAESAWVNGPFSVQGEVIHSFVQRNGGGTLNFGGFYGEAGWFLTGESRPYNPGNGDFKRLVPLHNFNFGQGGWGALELAARFSHTDLSDGAVHGGKLNELMTAANWYLNPHVRWTFNYGMGHVWGGPQDGKFFIFQTRISVDF
ncbi:MAG TPA: porin [Verrucomicrobiae bacterium]|nr:porin [Verrucomicrobiae bacterium]